MTDSHQKNFTPAIVRHFRRFRRRAKKLLLILLPQFEPVLDNRIRKKLLLRLQEVDRVNVGCGRDRIEGWLNIDLFVEEDLPYGRFVKTEDGVMLLHFDATKELPFPDNYVKYVYASHFIEHMDLEKGLAFLSRCYRVMQKGGIVRLALPDLGLWITKYNENDMDFFNRYRQAYPIIDKVALKTKGEVFSAHVHGFGHRWCYDCESIQDLMERAGFLNVSQKRAFESSIPDIQKIDIADKGRLLESIFIEGYKP